MQELCKKQTPQDSQGSQTQKCTLGAQEEAGRGEWMVRGSGSPLLRPEPGYLPQSTRHENAGQTLPSQTRVRPLASTGQLPVSPGGKDEGGV